MGKPLNKLRDCKVDQSIDAAADCFEDFVPPSEYSLLRRGLTGGMISVDTYASSLGEATNTTDLTCLFCRQDTGQEVPQDFSDPSQPGAFLTDKDAVFEEQRTWIVLPCCGKEVHRGCLIHMSLDIRRRISDWDEPQPRICAHCRQRIHFDNNEDCWRAALRARTFRACQKAAFGYTGQSLPDDDGFAGRQFTHISHMCFIIARDNGEAWADTVLAKKICTAIFWRMLLLEYAPFYCRGQVWTQVMTAVNGVIRKEFSMTVGDAVGSWQLDAELYQGCMATLSRALNLYTESTCFMYKMRQAGLIDNDDGRPPWERPG